MKLYKAGASTVSIVEGDITRESTDAIVNAANAMLLGGGGVDGAIHRAAGDELLAACRDVKKTLPEGLLGTGLAVATPGFQLAARHVIHTVGPVYGREGARAPKLLASCYESALRLCRELDLASVAFPAISTGVYGYPLDKAADVSLRAVLADLERHGRPSLVRFVLFGAAARQAFENAAERVFVT